MVQTTLSSFWAKASLGGSSDGSHAAMHEDGTCHIHHDPVAVYLSVFLCFGLVLSYLPQLIRIVVKRSSQGFSPWFLLLGSTSGASSFLNVVALQWGIVRCCPSLPSLQCAESLLGVLQVGLQWLMFTTVFILFLIYYPKDMRYERAIALPDPDRHDRRLRARARRAAKRAAATRSASANAQDGHAKLAAPKSLVGASADDASSTGSGHSDLDSVDSHIARNYASASRRAESTATTSDDEEREMDGEEDDDQDPEALLHPTRAQLLSARDASSSAFSRLVPTFWPMWKAPSGAQADAPGHARATQDLLATAPRGIRRIERQRRAKLIHRAPQTHKRKTEEWSLALALAWVVLIHFTFIVAITLILVSSLPAKSFPPPEEVSTLGAWHSVLANSHRISTLQASARLLVSRWAAFLGTCATILAAGQYLPQIVYTSRTKLVGSLSIPMMCLQVPGSAIFVYSLALQPGTDWSSLAAYVLSGILQFVLLVLCIAWRIRQHRAGIDDFGRPLQVAVL